ncbi:guanylate kinase [Pelagibacteraceae bacterium]|jgi:guanylate kinase|nr:guanylate kinase [Pelagibacteraceae bacterium]
MNDENLNHEPLLIVVSSPSGAGKTSVCRKLLENNDNIKISISATTRKPRKNEVDGIDYNFISRDDFQNKIKNNEFLEYAEVFDNFYGSLIKDVENISKSKKDVLFDIDWQGTQQLYQSKPSNLVSIFILPPSKAEIENRLRQRQVDSGDDESIISQRMFKFKNEISHWVEYDYVVINEDLGKCVNEISNIINTERKKRHRQIDLFDKVRELTS